MRIFCWMSHSWASANECALLTTRAITWESYDNALEPSTGVLPSVGVLTSSPIRALR